MVYYSRDGRTKQTKTGSRLGSHLNSKLENEAMAAAAAAFAIYKWPPRHTNALQFLSGERWDAGTDCGGYGRMAVYGQGSELGRTSHKVLRAS